MWQLEINRWGRTQTTWADALGIAADGTCVFLSIFGTEDATAALVSAMGDRALSMGHGDSLRISPLLGARIPRITWPFTRMGIERERIGHLWHVVLQSQRIDGNEILWMPHGDWRQALNDWAQQGTLPWTPEWSDWLYQWLHDERLRTDLQIFTDPRSRWKNLAGIIIQPVAREGMKDMVPLALDRGLITLVDDPDEEPIEAIPDGATLETYLQTLSPALGRKMEQMITTRWRPGESHHPVLTELKRTPFVAQADAIEAGAKTLTDLKNVILVGEMGVGKTLIGASIPWRHHQRGGYRVLVMAPGHLVPKWQREIEELIPGVTVSVIRTLTDIKTVAATRGQRPSGPEYYILSRDRAKLGYVKEPAIVNRRGYAACPTCYAVQRKHSNAKWATPLTVEEWTKGWSSATRCSNEDCQAPLWKASARLKRVALAEGLTRWTKNLWDYFIADEFHELKGGHSAQGQVLGDLARLAKHTILLSGTLNNGYAHDLFYILWRIAPGTMRAEGLTYRDVTEWTMRYGVQEHVTRDTADKKGRDVTRTAHYARPGISPALLGRHLLGRTIFVNLEDLGADLPPYEEQAPHVVTMADDQAEAYKNLRKRLVDMARGTWTRFGGQNNALMVSALQLYPDHPFGIAPLAVTRHGEVVQRIDVPECDAEKVYPKEQALLAMLKSEIAQGRRCIVYVEFTHANDVSIRLAELAEAAGLHPAIMRSSKVPPERREGWIADQVRHHVNVLIAHPRMVATGLDLLEWPTLIFYETGNNLLEVRQASRRSWRIGQTQPVKIAYFAYQQTVQEAALRMMGAKLVAAMGLEGKFSDDGLNSLADGDMTAALAKAILDGIDRSQSLETLWADMNRKRILTGAHPTAHPVLVPTAGTGAAPTATIVVVEDETTAPLLPDGFVLIAPDHPKKGRRESSTKTAQIGWRF